MTPTTTPYARRREPGEPTMDSPRTTEERPNSAELSEMSVASHSPSPTSKTPHHIVFSTEETVFPTFPIDPDSGILEPESLSPQFESSTPRGEFVTPQFESATSRPDSVTGSPNPISSRSTSESVLGSVDGYNDSISTYSERIDSKLPPIDLVEDIATASKFQCQIPVPVISDLIREGPMVGKEKIKGLVLQIFIPFLLAGFGMVAAGIVLENIQKLDVFKQITEIFIMVPALLGLKGNLEMTLASRLSTQVNIGGFDDSKRKWRIIGCNVALNQVLASGVGVLAAIVAVIFYVINNGPQMNHRNILLLFATAMISATTTSVIQDSIMISIVLLAKRFKVNPDNVATPVAGTIGDILTLGILVGVTLLYWTAFKTSLWAVGPAVSICVIAFLLPMWIFFASKEPTTRHVLAHGWLPVIVAMIISSFSGVILQKVLDSELDYFKGLPLFQPLINGVGGNIVSVQASRIATFLHMAYSKPGHVPIGYRSCQTPCHTFCSSSNINARTARLLMLMVVPGHLIFLFVISFVDGSTSISLRFAFVFLVMALIQVTVLLYLADILTHFSWKKALDPDSTTIPYVTAAGDLLGTGLLALGFFLMFLCGQKGGRDGLSTTTAASINASLFGFVNQTYFANATVPSY